MYYDSRISTKVGDDQGNCILLVGKIVLRKHAIAFQQKSYHLCTISAWKVIFRALLKILKRNIFSERPSIQRTLIVFGKKRKIVPLAEILVVLLRKVAVTSQPESHLPDDGLDRKYEETNVWGTATELNLVPYLFYALLWLEYRAFIWRYEYRLCPGQGLMKTFPESWTSEHLNKFT